MGGVGCVMEWDGWVCQVAVVRAAQRLLACWLSVAYHWGLVSGGVMCGREALKAVVRLGCHAGAWHRMGPTSCDGCPSLCCWPQP